ncbi:MAG: type II toxin-antitoxin system VapC family toxin [Litoreibacter sp.]|uniref:type II toxin-antitoxin system VapC family toxin n=1 Tax=Litoreibacter sp. TaxID=1969459 RepID=UPI003296FBFA
MKLLLDTHILLWALADDPSLPKLHREALAEADIYVSAASVWEVGIKTALGKLDVPENLFDVAVQSGCRQLPISWAHAKAASSLPLHHGDPFDRMLIAQANLEGMTLASVDKMMRRYDVELLE